MSRISFLFSGLLYNFLIYSIIIRLRYSASNNSDWISKSYASLFLSYLWRLKKRERYMEFLLYVCSLFLILVR